VFSFCCSALGRPLSRSGEASCAPRLRERQWCAVRGVAAAYS